MTISAQSETFAGYPVKSWQPGEPLSNPAKTLFRIALDYDESDNGVLWTDKFAEFLDTQDVESVPGVVVGAWEEIGTGESSQRIVEALVGARESLPNVHAIFFGDITYEESEISWIEQTDMSPLLAGYSGLTDFCVRGGNNLSLGQLNYPALKSLTVQTGGLSSDVVAQVCNAELPALEHLELWLGSDSYGFNCTIEDFSALMQKGKFPSLKYLGLKDSDIADDLAVALSTASVLEQLEVLDLSMGTLGDRGAEALIQCPTIKRLKKVILRHHYMSASMTIKWQSLGIEVDVSDKKKAADEDDRYVEVSE